MNKLKTAAVLLMSLLITVLAMLPQAMAGVSDFLANEKPGTAVIQSVELAFGSGDAGEPGYMMRRLALEQRMTTIPIEPEQASMTEDQVLTAAREGMDAYVEADMFDWFEDTFCSAEPYLGIDPENKNNNAVFWGVTFSTKNDPYHYLFLHIDDETGTILYINYETYRSDNLEDNSAINYETYKPEYSSTEGRRQLMEWFVDAFFRPLNLAQRIEYKNLLGESVTERELADDVTCAAYTFDDAQYGTIYVEFYITPSGFHVYYPSE